jgi:hypothetical protein
VEDLCLDVWGCVRNRCGVVRGGVAWSTVARGEKGDIKVFADSVGGIHANLTHPQKRRQP